MKSNEAKGKSALGNLQTVFRLKETSFLSEAALKSCALSIESGFPLLKDHKSFCIETEETVKGFPDVLLVNKKDVGRFILVEFKLSDAKGRVKFKRSQPVFYIKNRFMWDIILVCAHNNATGVSHLFNVKYLFEKDSPYKLNEKREVTL